MNRQFPAFRGLAIFLVILNHSITLSLLAGSEYHLRAASGVEKILLVALKELGPIAVPIFLFLSGAFLVYAVQGKPLKTAYKVVFSSLKHVVMPYLFWSTVYYVVMYFLKGESLSIGQYVKNLLVGYPFNFVPLLVFFYLIAPFIVRLGKAFPWAVIAIFGLYQLFLINALKPGMLGFAFPAWASWLTPPVLRITLAIWGIFFPLGVLYSQHREGFNTAIRRFWPALAALALGLYVVAILHEAGFLSFPLAEVFLPLAVILMMPLVQRDWMPVVRFQEQLGKRAYGLYLTNLIIINLVLTALQAVLPGLLSIYLIVVLVLVFAALVIPLLLIQATDRLTGPTTARYVFG